jgi:hypothetical protein
MLNRDEKRGQEGILMKRICCLYAENQCNVPCIDYKNGIRQFSSHLMPDDILYLQKIFLTKGFHRIHVPTVCDGRSLMYKLLRSMHFFNDIACLTCITKPAISLDVCDLLGDLRTYCKEDTSINTIEEFFLDVFFTDFMWIELNEALLNDPMVQQAVYIMHAIEIAHRIPVIAISYNN